MTHEHLSLFPFRFLVSLIRTHGLWATLLGGATGAPRGGAGAGAAAEVRRRARRVTGGAAAGSPLLWLGGALGLRLAAARILAQALRRAAARWRRRRTQHKLG
jgi:hypothetical protein